MTDIYVICVQGHLDARWSEWLEGMAVRHEADGTSTLEGPLPDQSALHGVLTRMRDLGVPIISFRKAHSR
jgi:hypothetical protein